MNSSMDERPLNLAILRTFSPLDGLKAENLHALARKTVIRELTGGRVLFKEGDTDKRTFYLVAGQVELRAEDRIMGVIRAGTAEARAALAPGLPRKFTARAANDIEYLQASGNYVNLHVRGREYPLRATMAGIEERLDPARFVRVHRSYFINLDYLAEIEPLETGDARLQMRDSVKVPCSRRYRAALRERFGSPD